MMKKLIFAVAVTLFASQASAAYKWGLLPKSVGDVPSSEVREYGHRWCGCIK
jgi:hypothetical protein